jgi:ABC-2 type transport system permease protein
MIGGLQSEGFIFFVMTQQFMKNLGIFGSALAVLLGASPVAKEMEAGTMEFLLAQPISRTRVLVEKYLFNLVLLAIPLLLSTLLVYPAARAIGAHIGLSALLVAGLYSFCLLAVVYTFVFLLGVLIDTQMHVILGGIALCLVMTVLVIFADTRPLSLFGYLDMDALRPIFSGLYVPVGTALVFVLLSALMFATSVVLFRRKTI